MATENDYGMFDDDAEDIAPEKKTKRKKIDKEESNKKKKIDKEGSKKNKKGKGIRKPLVKIVIGGIVLCVAASFFLGKNDQTTKPAQSVPQDDYYLTVNFTDVEKMNLDDLYIYSEGGQHTLVYMIDGTNDAMSVCDNYVIEDAKSNDAANSLTPLEGTELLESLVQDCTVVTGDKIDMLSFAGTEYYISVDNNDVKSKLSNSDCDNIVSSYSDENGTTYDNLSELLEAKVNSNNLGKSK